MITLLAKGSYMLGKKTSYLGVRSFIELLDEFKLVLVDHPILVEFSNLQPRQPQVDTSSSIHTSSSRSTNCE
jgi:hypothetical protein